LLYGRGLRADIIHILDRTSDRYIFPWKRSRRHEHELISGCDDVARLPLTEPDVRETPQDLLGGADVEEVAASEPLDGGPAGPRPRLRGEDAEGELGEEVAVCALGPDPPEVGEAGVDRLFLGGVEGEKLIDLVGVHRGRDGRRAIRRCRAKRETSHLGCQIGENEEACR